MKKTLFVFLFLFLTVTIISAQKFVNQNQLTINETRNSQIKEFKPLDPKEIAELNRQINANKTAGYVFAGIGAAAVATGISAYAGSRNDPEGLGEMAGIMVSILGAQHLGASVPFFFKAHKKKKEKDELQNL